MQVVLRRLIDTINQRVSKQEARQAFTLIPQLSKEIERVEADIPSGLSPALIRP